MNAFVTLVLNPNFGEQLSNLGKNMPIWIISSPTNDEAVKIARQNSNQIEITILYLRPNETPSDLLVRAIYDIEEHHGVISQEYPYTKLHVYGSVEKLSQKVVAELEFEVITYTTDGFTAKKHHSKHGRLG